MNLANKLPARGKTAPGPSDPALHDLLKHCSVATREAAIRFRQGGRPDLLPDIVVGVIEHHVESGLRPRLHTGDDDLRLAEDLGLDSLTLMEIVLLMEDVLLVTIGNDDLGSVRTLGDVKNLVTTRLSAPSAPAVATAPWPFVPKTTPIL